MHIEVVTIGDELLDGRVADTNTVRLALALREHGLSLVRRTSVLDEEAAIVAELEAVVGRGANFCVVSGGLGPTGDDITAACFATWLGVPLVRDPIQEQRIVDYLESRGRVVGENQRKQADRPQGAEILENQRGTAPGFCCEVRGCRFVVVPGVPLEFDHMLETGLLPHLPAAPGLRYLIKTFGWIEAQVDEAVSGAVGELPVQVGYRASFPEIHVRLVASPENADDFGRACSLAQDALGPIVFTDDESMSFAGTVIELLRTEGLRLALAESCSGGLMSHLLTEVPGASDVLVASYVTYSNNAKVDVLGVSPESLERYGAVSEEVVAEMARGAARRGKVPCSVAISGIAGPDGGTDQKPVGTIWLAALLHGEVTTKRLRLPFTRSRNKMVGAYSGLDMLRRLIQQ